MHINKREPVLVSKKRLLDNERFLGYVLIAPVVIIIVVLIFYSIARGGFVSLQEKMLGVPNPEFVGLKNYIEVFKDNIFRLSFKQSMIWTISSLISQIIIGMLLALLLNKKFKGRFFFRGLLIVPWVTPVIVMATIFKWMMNGLYGILNQILVNFKLIETSLGWFSDPKLALPLLIGINIWRGSPFMMLMFLAGLQAIPNEIKDAARVDGTSTIQEFFYITLPFLKRIIIVVVLIFFLWNFNNFDLIYLLTNGGPGYSTFTLPVYVYSLAFESFKSGQASAVSIIMFVILAIISLLYFRVYKEKD